MKFKALILLSSVCLSVNTFVNAQNDFYLNGMGRFLISDNRLNGGALAGNTTTPNKGVSGYSIFDLTPTIKVGDNLKALVTLRLKSPFGAFFGNGTQYQIRQFQIGGKIAGLVTYEVGDINVGEGMSKYAMNNADDLFYKYESQVFTQRRQILEYENFNFGNKWRLQGAQARTKLAIGAVVDTIGAYGFVVRTNATNDANIADRILTGGRLSFIKNNMLTAHGNYVGLLDIPVTTTQNVYKNHVFIGDATYGLDLGAVAIKANIESGISTYDFTSPSDSVSYKDYFYDGGVNANVKGLQLNFFGSYKNVGPQFYNPAAQTRRLNVDNSQGLFGTIGANPRAMTLFDRYSNESQYNRSLVTTLGNFMPQYNNASPYGTATPNRTGITLGLATDTSTKIINAELKYEILKEIIGENIADLRNFNVLTTGGSFDLGKFIASERKYMFLVGYRNEATTRDGLAKIDLKNSLLDAGLSIEILKKLDLLLGYKKLTSVGNELISARTIVNKVDIATAYKFNIAQDILSTGVNIKFSTNSFLNMTYNWSTNTTGMTSNNYNINQFFMNLTVNL